MTMSNSNVLSGTMSSSAVTKFLKHVGSFNNPPTQISSFASSYLSASVPDSELLLSTAKNTIAQQFTTITPLYGNYLLPIPSIHRRIKMFSDWLEQFEVVSVLAGWSGHAKLVNFATHLRGKAYSFYQYVLINNKVNMVKVF